MKLFALGFAIVALASAVFAAVPSVEYLPPVGQDISEGSVSSYSVPSNDYLAPVGQTVSGGISSGVLADDGYRYRTVKRYRLRHRRDVNELPTSEYLPPVQHASVSHVAPQYSVSQVSVPQVAQDYSYSQESVPQVAQDYSFSHVSAPQVSSVSLPSNEYLAPVGQSVSSGISSGVLADDGYHYRTVKRYRLRHRRNVNELPTSEYLPPVQHASVSHVAPQYSVSQVSVPQVAQDYSYSQESVPQVAQDYSVSHVSVPQVSSVSLPSNEYLAPVGQSVSSGISSGVLADDGYRYRTVKRYRLRHRRDVNELPTSEYLPPVQHASVSHVAPQYSVSQVSVPQVAQDYSYSQVSVPQVAQDYSVSQVSVPQVAQDYSYSQVSVPQVAQDYSYSQVSVPQVAQDYSVSQVSVPQVASQYSASQVSVPQVSSVSLPSNEYLAPVGQSASSGVSSAVLADDGYHYRSVKRYRLRHRH